MNPPQAQQQRDRHDHRDGGDVAHLEAALGEAGPPPAAARTGQQFE